MDRDVGEGGAGDPQYEILLGRDYSPSRSLSA